MGHRFPLVRNLEWRDGSTWIYKGWRKISGHPPLLTEACNYLRLGYFDQWQVMGKLWWKHDQWLQPGLSCMDRLEYLIGWNRWPQSRKKIVLHPFMQRQKKIVFTWWIILLHRHFSKFIRPGAKRISVLPIALNYWQTGFVNTDGSVAVVVITPQKKILNRLFSLEDKLSFFHAGAFHHHYLIQVEPLFLNKGLFSGKGIG